MLRELMQTTIIAPVCTTELGLVAALQDEFDKRGVKVIGLSANDLDSHEKWINDINEINSVDLQFPIIADADRKVSELYDMLDHQVKKRTTEGSMQYILMDDDHFLGCYQHWC